MFEKKKIEKKKEESMTVFLSFVVAIFSSSRERNHWKYILTISLDHGPLHFCTIAPLLLLPLQNPLDHVDLNICLLGTLNSMVTLTFFSLS